jgi:hypothetical protein
LLICKNPNHGRSIFTEHYLSLVWAIFLYLPELLARSGILFPIPAGYRVIGVTDKKDSVDIASVKKGKRTTAKMKITEKNVLQQKRWATHVQTPSLP